jgi:RsiW-degrading membrane proteinase PrsW (M82 family)
MSSPKRSVPNGCLVFVLTCVLLSAVALGGMIQGLEVLVGLGEHPAHTVLALGLSTLFAAPLALALLWIDRHEPEPWSLILGAFAWGALGATGIAIVVNTLVGTAVAAAIDAPAVAQQLTASFSAPPVEETSKALALFALVAVFRREVHGAVDGLLYGALVGLGFEWAENATYILDAGQQGPAAMVRLAVMRGLVGGPGTHAAWCALVGLGVGMWRANPRSFVGVAAPIAGWVAAIACHFVWNTFAGLIGHDFDLTANSAIHHYIRAALVLQLPMLGFIALAIALAWRHEDDLLRAWLTAEPKDIVHPGDSRRLLPASRRAWSVLRALTSRGLWAARDRRALGHLLIRLAFARWSHHTDESPWSPDEDEEVVDLRARVRALRERGVEL